MLRQHLDFAAHEVNSGNGQTERFAFPQAQADAESHGNAYRGVIVLSSTSTAVAGSGSTTRLRDLGSLIRVQGFAGMTCGSSSTACCIMARRTA